MEPETTKYTLTFMPIEDLEAKESVKTYVIEDTEDYLRKHLMAAYDDLPQSILDKLKS